jgi:hypothetical protein
LKESLPTLIRALLLGLLLARPALAGDLLAPGDSCRVESPLPVNSRSDGKGRWGKLPRGTLVKIVARTGDVCELAIGKKRPFGRCDRFEKGCVKRRVPEVDPDLLRR